MRPLRHRRERLPRPLLWSAAIAGALALVITWVYADTVTFLAVALWVVTISVGVTAGARLRRHPETVAAKVVAIMLLILVLVEVVVVIILLMRYMPRLL